MTVNENRAIELLINEEDANSHSWSFFCLVNAILPNSIYSSVPHSESENIDNIKKGVA